MRLSEFTLHRQLTRSFPNGACTTMHCHSRAAPTASLRHARPYSVAAFHTRVRSTSKHFVASSHSRACRLAPTAHVCHYSQVAFEPGLPAHTTLAPG